MHFHKMQTHFVKNVWILNDFFESIVLTKGEIRVNEFINPFFVCKRVNMDRLVLLILLRVESNMRFGRAWCNVIHAFLVDFRFSLATFLNTHWWILTLRVYRFLVSYTLAILSRNVKLRHRTNPAVVFAVNDRVESSNWPRSGYNSTLILLWSARA